MRDGTGAGAAPVPGGQSPGQPPQAALQVGVPGAAPAPPEAPAVLEELLRELHLLLRGTQRPRGVLQEEGGGGEGDPGAGGGDSGAEAPRGRAAEPGAVSSWGQEKPRFLPKGEPWSGFGVRHGEGAGEDAQEGLGRA